MSTPHPTPDNKKNNKPIHSDKVYTVVTTVGGAIEDGVPGTCQGPGNSLNLDWGSSQVYVYIKFSLHKYKKFKLNP